MLCMMQMMMIIIMIITMIIIMIIMLMMIITLVMIFYIPISTNIMKSMICYGEKDDGSFPLGWTKTSSASFLIDYMINININMINMKMIYFKSHGLKMMKFLLLFHKVEILQKKTYIDSTMTLTWSNDKYKITKLIDWLQYTIVSFQVLAVCSFCSFCF